MLRRRLSQALPPLKTCPTPSLIIEGELDLEQPTLDFGYQLQRLARSDKATLPNFARVISPC
jgi:hypothetical protein